MGNDVVITNDGATILKKLQVQSPAARMLVELSKAQDIEAGDGTTTVVVIAGALLNSARDLLTKLHPNVISRSFRMAADHCVKVLDDMSAPIAEDDHEMLVKICSTALNSKVISGHSNMLAPMAVNSVEAVTTPGTTYCDLDDIKVLKCFGGTIDDSERVDGIVFPKKASHFAEGPTRIENAKIGLIQFCISPPKTDMENNVVVSDYGHMDRILREEKAYILKIVKAIKACGCSPRRQARQGCNGAGSGCGHWQGCEGHWHREHGPRSHSSASRIKQNASRRSRALFPRRTVCCSLSSQEALPYLCGGAPEVEMAVQLEKYARTLEGQESYCLRRFAEALEIIPYTLAENAGLQPMEIVTELRNAHVQGHIHHGINVRKGCVTDMMAEDVVQPLLVDTSAISLATEACRAILKIDDIVPTR